MRILYLSQYFPPEMGAPAARVHELSREWAALGHDVTVLTGFPHHPTGIVPPEYRGQLIRREEVDGIHLVRAPIYATANKGTIRRSMSYASFAVSATALGPFLTRRPEVVVGVGGYASLACLVAARLRRIPTVVHEQNAAPGLANRIAVRLGDRRQRDG